MRTIVFLFLIFQIPITSLSQKSAPVAGDAAQLIDLLKKDYNAFDQDLKAEQISKDMFKVISIFKSYLTDAERKKTYDCKTLFDKLLTDSVLTEEELFYNGQNLLGISSSDDKSKKIDKLCKKINETQQTFKEYNEEKQYYNSAKNTNSLYDYDLEDFEELKEEYFASKFYSDSQILTHLRKTYSDSNNSYLSYVLDLFIKKYSKIFNNKEDFSAQVNYSSSIQKSLPFFGGDLSFETIIDGLSRFLAKRLKEELTTHAIEKIQNYLNNPSQEGYLNELLVLLPKTTDYLKSFEASQVLNFTDDLKQYIERDLNDLLENAGNLRTTPRFQKLLRENPDIGFAFEAIDLIPQISKIKEPLDYFEIIENSPNLQRWAKDSKQTVKFNIANTIRFTSLIAHSLLIIDDGKQRLASLDFMSNYGSEKEFYLLYIGFLNQQHEKYFNVKFVKPNNSIVELKLKNLMGQVSPDKVVTTQESIRFLKERINRVVSNVEKLQTDFENIKKANKNNEDIKITQVHSLVETLLDFSETLAITVDDIVVTGKSLHFFDVDIDTSVVAKRTQPYFKTARSVNKIFLDLHKKNYTTAILGALEITSNFTNDKPSIGKIVSLQDVIISSNDLRLLKKFVAITRIPSSDNKKNELKDLAVKAEYIISSSSEPSLNSLKAQFNLVHNSIKNDKSDDFENEMVSLKAIFKLSYKKILEEYAQIPLTNSILNPVEKYIDSKGLSANQKIELKKYLGEFIKNIFKAYLLEDDSNLQESKETLLRYYEVYLPELSKSIFRNRNKKVIKIVHFITDMAIAENAQDVEAALEAFALPSGSSSVKEEASTYISINSYPGILGGFEISNQAKDKFATHFGVTAPIGIYTQFFKSKNGSWGLFLPILDIGAPVRFRLDDDNNTETLPDFDFKDVFSPGAYISYGFNKSPFAINAGIQYGPKLREISNATGSLNDIEAYRISLGFVIDIPLVALHVKTVD